MLDEHGLPRIVTLIDSSGTTNKFYHRAAQHMLGEMLLRDFFKKYNNIEDAEVPDLINDLHAQLPILKRTELGSPPCEISFFLLACMHPNAYKFFYDMISQWLIPGKKINVLLVLAVDFKMPDLSDQVYTSCEVILHIENIEDMEAIKKNLSTIEAEICLGIKSRYHAQRILEIKGLKADEKTALIHEHLADLLKRLPDQLDLDLISEMQHILVICNEDFKLQREFRHLSRIICVHYLFRKELRRLVCLSPQKRHISLKVLRTRIHTPEGVKTVLGLIVGVNFLKENELFEEQHLIKAIQHYIPNIKLVEGSFFSNKGLRDSIATLYIEVEKTTGGEFSAYEIQCLRKELPADLKDRIQQLMHPIFMPQNEEEVMRNILTLSNQLKFIRDIPQVIITFDQQTDEDVVFSVILLRILKPQSLPIESLLDPVKERMGYRIDRVKLIGSLRGRCRYQKEANVFHVSFPKRDFLRHDHSLDLQKVRQEVVNKLSEAIGDFRDYNGGMISKQNEVFCELRNLLWDLGKEHEHLLENFFYAMRPVVMRTIVEPTALATLFRMLLEAIDVSFFKSEHGSFLFKEDDRYTYVILSSEDADIKEEVDRALKRLDVLSLEIASTFVKVYDMPYVGFILRSDDVAMKNNFKALLASYSNA